MDLKKSNIKPKNSKSFWNNATEEKKLERLEESYNKMVVKKDGCWDWKGFIRPDGYVRISCGTKAIGAHIVSWMIHKGDIPSGIHVLHKCDFPTCTNPEHLFLGTHADNMADMIRKGRFVAVKGEDQGQAILTNELVLEIKELLLLGVKCKRIADDLGYARYSVYDINMDRSWKNIECKVKYKALTISDTYREKKLYGNAKLNINEVRKIKKLLKMGVAMTRIALYFNAGKTTIRRIKVGVAWKHVN